MRGGDMDARVTIQRATQTQSRSGELQTIEWADVGKVWAGELSVKAAERYASQQMIAEAETAFKMRVWPGPEKFGPQEQFRLVVGGVPHYVVAVMRVRGRRSNGGFIVGAKSRQEVVTADGDPVGEA